MVANVTYLHASVKRIPDGDPSASSRHRPLGGHHRRRFVGRAGQARHGGSPPRPPRIWRRPARPRPAGASFVSREKRRGTEPLGRGAEGQEIRRGSRPRDRTIRT